MTKMFKTSRAPMTIVMSDYGEHYKAHIQYKWFESTQAIRVDESGLQPIDCTLSLRNLIVVIDEKSFIRQCIARCFCSTCEGSSVTAFATIAECAQADIDFNQVRFIFYNIYQRRPSDPDVEASLKQLGHICAAAPIIILSDSDDAIRVVEALERGVRGYIPTSSTMEITISAASLISAGGTFVPANSLMSLTPSAEDPRPVTPLAHQFTHRQMAVLSLVRQGKPNRAIAHELQMSESTVKAHVRNIMEKLKATNRTQVVFVTRELFSTRACSF